MFRRFGALALVALATLCFSQSSGTREDLITVSGGHVTINNSTGSPVLPTFNEKINGGPSTISVVVQGCQGGTCQTIDTYTTVADAIRTPNIGATYYDSFVITASWTGGTGAYIDVTTHTTGFQIVATGGSTWGSITGTLSDQTDLVTALGLKAPLASPALSGTPIAPTVATNDNSTSIATTQWVKNQGYGAAGSAAWGSITGTLSSQSDLSTALGLKAPLASPTFSGTVGGITKSMVGLGSVDNTADTAKPVSTAQQTALDLKADLASPTFTGTVSGITKSMVGLGSVDNTADTAKPVSTAQQTALDLKANLAGPTFSGTLTTTGTIDATKLTGALPAISGASLTSVNAATLGSATFAAPGTIGGGTPGAITGTTITATTSMIAPSYSTTGSTGGLIAVAQGTDPTLPVNAFSIYAPTSIATAYGWSAPTAENGSAGVLHLGAAASHKSAMTVSAVVDADLSGTVGVAHGGWALATLTAHALYAGNGTSAPTAIGPDSSTTKALFAAGSSADPAYRAIANGDLPVKTQTCEIVIGGTGASNVLQTGDDTIAGGSCYNGSGQTETITGIFCLADTGTTSTVTPIIHGGGTILSGALTCGNNVWSSSGTLSGTPTISSAASVDGAITAVGTAHDVHIAIVYTVPAS